MTEKNLKIDLIIMAAGSSRRFGSNKLLYPLQGRPLYSYVLEQVEQAVERLSIPSAGMELCENGSAQNIPAAAFCRVFVVSRFEEILKAAEEKGWQAVYSPESEQGASWTVKNGLSAAGGGADYYMFLTSDQPCLQADSVVRLVRETAASGKGIGSMCWQDQPGNPVIFHGKYLPELLLLEGDTGGRKVAKKHTEDCFFCQAGRKEELADADRPETMEIILDYMRKM
ncbi:MAG: nucleotidyltransferase family protein [Lachnospiraceae bacterium]|nr:nucleotidyltransferase family protein [Lachnospiraceae bacterium]